MVGLAPDAQDTWLIPATEIAGRLDTPVARVAAGRVLSWIAKRSCESFGMVGSATLVSIGQCPPRERARPFAVPPASGTAGAHSTVNRNVERLSATEYPHPNPNAMEKGGESSIIRPPPTAGENKVLRGPYVMSSFPGPEKWGIVESFASFGALCGGLVLGILGNSGNAIWLILGSELVISLLGVVQGLFPVYWVMALSVFALSLAVSFCDGSIMTLWQRKVRPELQGRVFALKDSVNLALGR